MGWRNYAHEVMVGLWEGVVLVLEGKVVIVSVVEEVEEVVLLEVVTDVVLFAIELEAVVVVSEATTDGAAGGG